MMIVCFRRFVCCVSETPGASRPARLGWPSAISASLRFRSHKLGRAVALAVRWARTVLARTFSVGEIA